MGGCWRDVSRLIHPDTYQGGGARYLACITAQMCATRIASDTPSIVQPVEQWHTLTPGACCLAVSWHRCKIGGRYQPPTPGCYFFETLGGVGGAPFTQEPPNSEAGDPIRADVGMH